MPAIKIRGSSSSSSSSGSTKLMSTEVKKPIPVLVVVEEGEISVYTEQEALDELNKG